MKKDYDYAVFTEGNEDNRDNYEWFTSFEEAFSAWHAIAEDLEEGKSVYIAKFERGGDIIDGSTGRLAKEDNTILEYDNNGNRCWA